MIMALEYYEITGKKFKTWLKWQLTEHTSSQEPALWNY